MDQEPGPTCLESVTKILSDFSPDIRVDLPHKGDVLYFQGDHPSYLYIVSLGTLMTIMESPSGDPVIWEILGPSEAVGIFALLMGFPYPATCRVHTSAQVLGYSRERVLDRLEKDKFFRETLVREIGDRFQIFLSRLLFSKKSVEARISMSLLSLARKIKEPHGNHPPLLNVTRYVLASLSLTTVESTIRITKKWETNKLVDFPSSGRIRILDRKALEKISEI